MVAGIIHAITLSASSLPLKVREQFDRRKLSPPIAKLSIAQSLLRSADYRMRKSFFAPGRGGKQAGKGLESTLRESHVATDVERSSVFRNMDSCEHDSHFVKTCTFTT